MKVLFLAAANSIHTVRWVNALAERGHEVHLVYNTGHEPRENIIDGKVFLHCLKYGGGKAYYLNARELKRLKEEIAPEITNVHYASGYGTLAREAKIGPILLSVWGSDVYDFPNKNFMNRRILKKNVKYAEKIASTSDCMAKELRKTLSMPDLEIGITPFGVDLERFELMRKREKKNDKILLGNIKTLEPLYGIAEFIKAVKMLKNNLKNGGKTETADKIQAVIYGDGSQKQELEKLIEALDLTESVFLKGRIPNKEVPQILSEFDVFCATSFRESFGVSIVEAMAMELPVVVTAAEGFKEVVVEGETGIVTKIGCVEEIAAALEKLVLSSGLRETYGKNGRKRVESLYDWKDNVSTMEQIYNSIKAKQIKGEAK